MRIVFSILGMLCLVIVSAADEPALLFRVKFDTYHVTADFAGGNPGSKNFHSDLQLRMHPGIDGQGNALCLNGSEFCAYEMEKNFTPEHGTVNFWVSAENWRFTDNRTQVFFEAAQKNFRLVVYKYESNPFVCVYLQYPGGSESVNAKVDAADWLNKKWHMVTAVWDSDSMAVYIDGRLPEKYAPGNVHPAIPRKEFNKPKPLPGAEHGGAIGIGNLFHRFHTSAEDRTAMDELVIYGRCLKSAEILALYEARRPSVKRKLPPPVLTVPRASCITLDGTVGDAEYADAARMPLMKAYRIENHKMRNQTAMRIKTDGENLLIGFTTDLPVTKRVMTADDQDIFDDDVFEFFMRDAKEQKLWFCINANGAILDAKNGDRKWNSGAKGAAKILDKGWSAEISIPLSSLDNPVAGTKRRANFRALNFASIPHYFMGWNGDPGDEEGISSVIFSGDSSCVSLESLGDIYKGSLDAKIRTTLPVTLTVNGEPVPETDGKFPKQLPAGKYLLEISAENVFSYNLEFAVESPLSVSAKPYPSEGFIELKIDLGNAGPDILNNLKTYSGHIALTKEGSTFSSADFKPETLSKIQFPLPSGLAPGQYEIAVSVEGPQALQTALPFRVPDMTPYRKHVALDHTVPDPWIRVNDCGNGVFEILDRLYEFNNSPFPAKMFSRGESVLYSQPVLTIDGVSVSWRALRIEEKYDDYVVLSGKGECSGLIFDWRGELWFDGLWKLDFTMTPESASKDIRDMHLQWSVPDHSAKCFLSRLHSGFIATPWDKDGKIEKKLNLADASWLTGHVTGMMWQPLSGANFVDGTEKTTVLRRGKENVEVTLNIIAAPVTLNQCAKYSLAFMATPGKRPPKGFRTVREGSYMGNPYQNIQISSTAGCNREDAVYGYAGHRMRFPDQFREKWIIPYGRKGIKLFPYHQPKGISQLDDEWDYFLAEWRTNPGYMQTGIKHGNDTIDLVHCCGEGIADLMAYRLEKLYADFPELGGIYYDISNVGTCDNEHHGHGGTDAFGQKYCDSTAMSLRHYLMRICKISHRHGKKTFIHAHNYFNPIAHNFADLWYPGEEFVWLYGNDPDHFYSEIPLAELQYAYSPVVRGAAVIRCNQISRVLFMDKLKPRAKELNGEAMAVRSFASAWLHDFTVDSDWINNRAVAKFWKIRLELNLDDAVFFGYWFNDAVRSASPHVFASWYRLKHPDYSHLIIVGNLGREDQKAALSVDWAKLGLDNSKVEIKELWNDRPLSFADLKDFAIPENSFILIGIKKQAED